MADEKPVTEISYDYIKGSNYRTVRPDGVWGGVTTRLGIYMALWSERPAIPKRSVFPVSADGTLGEELLSERVVRDVNAIREVQVGITFDIGLAKSIIKWLQAKIVEAEKIQQRVNGDKP